MADLALEVVQLQGRESLVSRRQEAGQRQVRDDRLSHGQLLGTSAHRLVGPGYGHDPELTVELRLRRQMDRGAPIGSGGHNAGPQGHGLDRGDGEALAADLVTAEVDVGGGAEIGIEQSSVVVPVIDAERALAEIPFHRIGALLLGEAQDAFINGGHRHPRRLAEAQALHLHRHVDAVVREDAIGGGDLDRQLPALGIQRHVDEAQRPVGPRGGDRIARLDHRHQHIGASAPEVRALQVQGRPGLADADGLEVDDVVGCDGHLGLARVGGLEGHVDGVALGIGLGPR